MSKYPFGLRGDPFAPPATLSAKESSRLIRRRIRAVNGDGGLLFPTETCDTIHSLAGGVPDVLLVLASKALAIAAADKARAVSPAHVRKAAESGAESPAPVAATPEPAASAPPAASPLPAEPVSATPSPVHEESPAAVSEVAPAAVSEVAPAAVSEVAPAAVSEVAPVAVAEVAPAAVAEETTEHAEAAADIDEEADPEVHEDAEPVAPGIESFDYADSDLPAFRPASMALPTRPSEDLPIEAREWVSRFIPSSPGPPPVTESDAPRETRTPKATPSRPKKQARGAAPAPASPAAPAAPVPAAPVATAEDPEPASLGRLAALYGPPPPRRSSRSNGKGRSNAARALVGVLGVVAILAIVLRYSTPGRLATPEKESSRPLRTAAREAEPEARRPAPVVTVEPRESNDQPPAGSAFYESSGGSAPRAGAESAPAVEPGRHAPSSRFALEVASFIFEERAQQERDRLAAAGLRARVVTTLEFGSRVYRVVVGGYPQPAAAERAADSLLSNGVVLQARVVTASPH